MYDFSSRIQRILSATLVIGMLGSLLLTLPPHRNAAAACFDWKAIFAANRSLFNKTDAKKRLLILTFVNKADDPAKQWLGDGLRLGLFHMLESAKDTDVIEVRTDQTSFETADMVLLGRKHQADYVLGGEYRDHENELVVYVRYVDVAKEESIKLEEEKMEWPNPQKFSELLIHVRR